MRLSVRSHGQRGGQADSEQNLRCPRCGQTGTTAVGGANAAAFTNRGEYLGRAAWKCYVCGSGFVVRGANTERIPVDRWSEIKARYDRDRQPSQHAAGR